MSKKGFVETMEEIQEKIIFESKADLELANSWTLNPSLDLTTVKGILTTTANPSTDSKVKGIVDAYKAVNLARPNKPPIEKTGYDRKGEQYDRKGEQ